jgi:ATP-dependent Clp protease ATP-binding subunit ClpC
MKTGIKSWRAIIKFTLYFFSIEGLLKTFLVPFQRERYDAGPGIWGWFEKGIFYIFITILGIIIRTVTICIGLLCLLLLLLLFPLFALIPIKVSFENMVRNGSLGREWAYPITWTLDKHGRDMRKMSEVLVIDHDNAIEKIERILARKTQQNVLIIGAQGLGKTTRLGYLARRMYRDLSSPALNGKRLIELFPEEMNIQDIQSCIKEAIEARNVVLVIENIERFNIIGIIEPYLDNNHFQMILTTDWSSYHSTFKKYSNLSRVCEVVELSPPDQKTTFQYLVDWTYSHGESKRFNNDALAAVIVLTDKLVMNQSQPEKSIDILEELATLPNDIITVADVEMIISQKTNVPLGVLQKDEKQKLIHLEDILNKYIIGQQKAVRAVASALKRGRIETTDNPKPIGSFLFLGPTGVGKTHTAKMLAQVYFGAEHMMIRFDMSEYRELNTMSRFVENLGSKIEASPFSLVFFDEIEKAHPDILNLFLQILDEGQLHTPTGRLLSFRNTIIICTSNAGARYMMQNESESQDFLIEYIIHEGILKPEFINRFDDTILYRTLARSDIQKVTRIMLDKLNSHLLKKQKIQIVITDELINAIAKKGHDPQFGVRPLGRVIQDDVETYIADILLQDRIPENRMIEIPLGNIVNT